jgi:hypothetical protein
MNAAEDALIFIGIVWVSLGLAVIVTLIVKDPAVKQYFRLTRWRR